MISGKSQFERRHVLYCDVLGFSDYCLSQFFEPTKCMRLFQHLDQLVTEANVDIDPSIADPESGRVPDYVVEPEAIYVSDAIVISTLATNVDAIWICEAAARIQNQLCYYGFLVRGSVVTGDLYHSGNTIFGPAIANAVKLEKPGSPPIILVSEDTLKAFRYGSSAEDQEIVKIREQQLIANEESHCPYIDPFWLAKIHTNQSQLHERTRANIDSWRSLIEGGLRHSVPEVRAKYAWMARRFNRCLSGKPSGIVPIDEAFGTVTDTSSGKC